MSGGLSTLTYKYRPTCVVIKHYSGSGWSRGLSGESGGSGPPFYTWIFFLRELLSRFRTFRGKAWKFDFFHILNIVGLRYGKNNGICFGAKYPIIFKKNENNRQPSKLPFETPNSSTSLMVSRVKINGYMVLKTLIYWTSTVNYSIQGVSNLLSSFLCKK